MDRLIRVENENTGGAIGWCLEAHDLAAAKLVAGRDQDRKFVQVLLREQLVSADQLAERIATLPLSAERLQLVQALLAQLMSR